MFDQSCAWEKGIFHEKCEEKNAIRTPYFWEIRLFLTKYGHESYVFLEIGLFWKKCGQESIDFVVKSSVQWFNKFCDFCTNYRHYNTGFFMKKLQKMTWEHKSKIDRIVWIIKKQNTLTRGWTNVEKLVWHPYVGKTWSTFCAF